MSIFSWTKKRGRMGWQIGFHPFERRYVLQEAGKTMKKEDISTQIWGSQFVPCQIPVRFDRLNWQVTDVCPRSCLFLHCSHQTKEPFINYVARALFGLFWYMLGPSKVPFWSLSVPFLCPFCALSVPFLCPVYVLLCPFYALSAPFWGPFFALSIVWTEMTLLCTYPKIGRHFWLFPNAENSTFWWSPCKIPDEVFFLLLLSLFIWY